MKKYALITGGSQRIGKSIAMELAQMGYNLVLHYNTSSIKAKALKTELENKGIRVKLIQFNFEESNDFDQLFKQLKNKEIHIEVLINNASDFLPSSITQPKDDHLNKMFKSNFQGPYLLTKAFSNIFNKGIIINLLDSSITNHNTEYFDYLLAKKTLCNFTQMASYHLAPKIRVNGICPGLILPPTNKAQEYLLEKAKGIPLKKVGQLKDIQRTVRFLIESDFITGQIIFIDGGAHLHNN